MRLSARRRWPWVNPRSPVLRSSGLALTSVARSQPSVLDGRATRTNHDGISGYAFRGRMRTRQRVPRMRYATTARDKYGFTRIELPFVTGLLLPGRWKSSSVHRRAGQGSSCGGARRLEDTFHGRGARQGEATGSATDTKGWAGPSAPPVGDSRTAALPRRAHTSQADTVEPRGRAGRRRSGRARRPVTRTSPPRPTTAPQERRPARPTAPGCRPRGLRRGMERGTT